METIVTDETFVKINDRNIKDIDLTGRALEGFRIIT